MSFIGADVFLQNLHSFRTARIDGRYGGGKTLLSVAIAKYFHEHYGYHIYSNVPIYLDGVVDKLPICNCEKCMSTYKDMLRVDQPLFPQNHTLVIYDEAWLTFRTGVSAKRMNDYLAFIRKVDLIMVMPSVLGLARDAAQLYVERTWNLGVFGLPVWVYEWGVTGKTVKDSGGKFILLRPSSYFGTYSTYAQPDEMQGLFNTAQSDRGAVMEQVLEKMYQIDPALVDDIHV